MSATAAKTKRSTRAAMGPYGHVGKIVGELDDRLGVAKGGRVFLDKIFPDHWSFMLGEIALYSFVVLLATGVFLSLYYVPSADAGRLPRHLRAAATASGCPRPTSRPSTSPSTCGAACSCARCTTGRPTSSSASIVVHMARIFFTGAFRKPRELNWTHRRHHADPGHLRGLHRLLAARRPDLGHRPPHRLLHRRVDPPRRQLPGHVPVGRAVPRQRDHHPALLHHPRPDHPAGAHRAALGRTSACWCARSTPSSRARAAPSTTWWARPCSRPSWPRPPASSSW